MNIRQRFSRYFYPQVFVILACGILFSLLVFWFALQKISQNNFLQKGNSIAQDRAQLLGFRSYIQPSAPVWDFFGILPAAVSSEKNCTYTVHYLSEHPGLWNTSNNISTSRYSFTKNDLLLLFQTQTQDIPLLLQQQFLAAAVNVINGADPGAIEASMRDASGWIDAHPPRIDLPEADSQKGLQLIRQLQDYNDGNTGPGLCPGQSDPLAVSTNSATSSLPATNSAIKVPQATGSVSNAVTAPQGLPTAHPERLTRKNSGSGGQAGETTASGPIPAVPPQVSESPQQTPANSATSNPPSPSPGQATEPGKGHRPSNSQQPAAGAPAPNPPPPQGDPQPAGSGGSNHGNGQGNGNSGSSGQGNNGGNQGNHYGNGHGNGNHGGGGQGKGH